MKTKLPRLTLRFILFSIFFSNAIQLKAQYSDYDTNFVFHTDCSPFGFPDQSLGNWKKASIYINNTGRNPFKVTRDTILHHDAFLFINSNYNDELIPTLQTINPETGLPSVRIGKSQDIQYPGGQLQQTFIVNTDNLNLNVYFQFVSEFNFDVTPPAFAIEVFEYSSNNFGFPISQNPFKIIESLSQVVNIYNRPDLFKTDTTSSGKIFSYVPWTKFPISLHGYFGKKIAIRITAGNCSSEGHIGYAYTSISCDNNSPFTSNFTTSFHKAQQFCTRDPIIIEDRSSSPKPIKRYFWDINNDGSIEFDDTSLVSRNYRIDNEGTHCIRHGITDINGNTKDTVICFYVYKTPYRTFTFLSANSDTLRAVSSDGLNPTYKWGLDGKILPYTDSIIIHPVTGCYQVASINEYCNSNEATHNVTITNCVNNVNLIFPDTICNGETFTASAQLLLNRPLKSYSWYFDNSELSYQDTNTVITKFPNPGPQTVFYVLTDACNQKTTFSGNVFVKDLNFTVQNQNDSILIINSSNFYSYQWYYNDSILENETNDTIIPQISGRYHALISGNLCTLKTNYFQIQRNFGANSCENIDFEQNNYSGWFAESGIRDNLSDSLFNLSTDFERIILSPTISENEVPGFSCNNPAAGTNAIIINKHVNNVYNAARLWKKLLVTNETKELFLDFALIFEKSDLEMHGFNSNRDGYFKFAIYKENNQLDSTLSFTIYESLALNTSYDFKYFYLPPAKTILWSDWTRKVVDLESLIGQNIKIEITVANCGYTNHSHKTRAYLDLIIPGCPPQLMRTQDKFITEFKYNLACANNPSDFKDSSYYVPAGTSFSWDHFNNNSSISTGNKTIIQFPLAKSYCTKMNAELPSGEKKYVRKCFFIDSQPEATDIINAGDTLLIASVSADYYQWTLNNTDLNINNDSLTVTTSGTYGLANGHNAFCLSPESKMTINYTGIGSSFHKNTTGIMSPVKDYIEINKSLLDRNATVLVFDICGKKSFYLEKVNETLLIPCANWEDGLYIVQIQNNNQTNNYKIIKY